MINDHLLNEKIDFYLKGKLSEQEKSAFVDSMKSNKELAEIVKVQKVANEVIRTKQLLRLKEKMATDLSKPSFFNSIYSFIAVGSAILATGAGLFWYSSSKNNSLTENENSKKYAFETKDTNNIASTPKTTSNIGRSSINKPSSNQITKGDSNIIEESILTQNNTIIAPTLITEEQKIINQSVIPLEQKKENVDCASLKMDNAIEVKGSCKLDPNGKISIHTSKINGGLAPYLISIKGISNSFKDKTEFYYLKSGEYTITLKDQNECIISKVIEIEELECAKSLAFAFTPELEKWTIPLKQNKQGTLKIFNKSGILVYNSEVSSDIENYWEGKSQNGESLESGYYTFIINYNDGDKETGSVSLIR